MSDYRIEFYDATEVFIRPQWYLRQKIKVHNDRCIPVAYVPSKITKQDNKMFWKSSVSSVDKTYKPTLIIYFFIEV
jgi:hypothetical protein